MTGNVTPRRLDESLRGCLRWLEESSHSGNFCPMPGLTRDLFVTEGQRYKGLACEEPEVTVEEL